MARKNAKERRTRKSNVSDGFRISNGPVVRPASEAEKGGGDFDDDVIELPGAHREPTLFVIARDPNTMFTYWSVDWPTIFAKTMPVDRQVHLRVHRADGLEEKSVAVEPMAGNCYIAISRPSGSYHVEIGYYQPADVWHSIATSKEVTMPRDSFAGYGDVDLATIPFHLSFQRLLDLLGASKGEALAEIISRLQKRAVTDDERDLLSPEEWETVRAMNMSFEEIQRARPTFNASANAAALRRRAEEILGFGSSSPAPGFGASSWS